jgi:predicted lactoylglutathione lyase
MARRNTADSLKAVEALKTWLGSKLSSKPVDTIALCVALTEDLKRIILSQSKTFQNFDTNRQTECASAINVTITESTAESLILFTADTLRSKAIDKAAGAERDVVQTIKKTPMRQSET